MKSRSFSLLESNASLSGTRRESVTCAGKLAGVLSPDTQDFYGTRLIKNKANCTKIPFREQKLEGFLLKIKLFFSFTNFLYKDFLNKPEAYECIRSMGVSSALDRVCASRFG